MKERLFAVRSTDVPTLHLTKVAFACRDLEMLQHRIAARSISGELRVATRMRPKRAAELIGGSLYWIVKHRLIACQQILRFEDREDGRIDIVCAAELLTVPPRPRRAHQGWRYLKPEDAPADLAAGGESAILPGNMVAELGRLGLL